MNLNQIEEKYNTLLKAIKICKDNDFVEPVFILLFSTIDSLSWLNSNEINIEHRNGKEEFKNFSQEYILNRLTQNIIPDEFYDARCAIVHTISAKSKNNKKNGTRYLTYSNSAESELEGNNNLKMLNENAVCINVFELLTALVNAITEFFNNISKDENKKKNVIEKSEEYYSIF